QRNGKAFATRRVLAPPARQVRLADAAAVVVRRAAVEKAALQRVVVAKPKAAIKQRQRPRLMLLRADPQGLLPAKTASTLTSGRARNRQVTGSPSSCGITAADSPAA